MTENNKASRFSLKAIYSSIAAALNFRQIDRDPGNRDVTRGDYPSNDKAPRVSRAIQLSTVWACVRLISNAVATMPLFVYERTETGGRETRRVARDHWLYALLHDSPNADQTAFEFRRRMEWNLLLWGNFFALKEPAAGRRLRALEPLDPSLMSVRRDANGAREYIYADPKGRQVYGEDEVWHLMGPSEDGLIGLSPIGVGWRSMLRAQNVGDAASRLFGGAMRPSGVVSIEPILDPDQRTQMKAKLLDGVFGDAALGRMHLLEGGAKFQQLTINPIDAQMMEQMNASVEDICRWFGVPPAKIGHGTAVSNWGTGREQQNLGFLQEVLDPDLTMIEQSIAKWLIPAADRSRYFAEFGREKLLSMDSSSRAAFYKSMITSAVYTPNFCRALENLEPLPGGDALVMQSNMIPLDMLGKVTSTAQNATIGQDKEPTDDNPD
jgi:HK97 family phage portal protein